MAWKYTAVLNSMIQILLTIGMGGIMGWAGIIVQEEVFVSACIRFVFYVALPSLVLQGIGVGVDFYSDKFLWPFIVAFLLLRVFALIVSLVWVLVGNYYWGATDDDGSAPRRHGLGHVAVHWLALTWISTIVMGIPIMNGLFGDEDAGSRYGLLAGISSFIFQLPLQLVFFECHALETEQKALTNNRQVSANDERQKKESDSKESEQQVGQQSGAATNYDNGEEGEAWSQVSNAASSTPPISGPTTLLVEDEAEDDEAQLQDLEEQAPTHLTREQLQQYKWWMFSGRQFVNRHQVWLKVLCRLVRNPVLWGIFWGFVLSLSTLGPTYFNPKSPDFQPGLGWFTATLAWLGACVSPVSLFAMGVWMQAQQGSFRRGLFLHHDVIIPPWKLGLYMLSKLIFVPCIMVGLAKWVRLDNESGRAAVLIATLPISLASFSLAHQYDIGKAELSTNVATGTLLMLPTVLIWNIVMDNVGLFPISTTSSTTATMTTT